MQVTHLNNSVPGIILLYTATQLPFTVFLLYGFVSKIPVDLDEAAVIDGCGPVRLFFGIIFPMMRSSIVTAAVLCFLNTWNEFVMPLYFLNSSEKWPMTLAVYNFFGQYEKSWNLICADILLTCLPVIIMYLSCQKYIVGGQTEGAVKG
jgi:raffinose/stachyose/melibiose transport system permease protein